MTDFKTKLSNVAFGGAWSEEYLIDYELSEALRALEDAVASCFEEDVRDAALDDALNYIGMRIHKGPSLQQAFLASLTFQEPYTREAMAKDVLDRIRAVAHN